MSFTADRSHLVYYTNLAEGRCLTHIDTEGRFLERKLKLVVNEEKSGILPTDQLNFLSFTFKGNKIRWSDSAFAEFKRRLRKLTGRSWFVSMVFLFSSETWNLEENSNPDLVKSKGALAFVPNVGNSNRHDQ